MNCTARPISSRARFGKGVGDLNNDDKLRDEGEADKAAGQVEEAIGKGRRKVGDAVKDLGDKISH